MVIRRPARNPTPTTDEAVADQRAIAHFANTGDWRHELGKPPPVNGHAPAQLLVQQSAPLDDDPALELSPADRVAALLSEVSGDDDRSVVKVLRENDAGRFEFCADYTPAEFEAGGLGMIRRQWGAGSFRICLYGYGAGGVPTRYGIRRREQVSIAKLAPGAEPEAAPSRLATVDPNAPPPWLGALLERMVPPPAVDPMAQLGSMFALMAQAREAFGMGQAPQKSTIGEVVDAIRELRDVREELDGNGAKADKEPSLMALGQQLIEVVRASLTQPQAAPPVTLPPALAAPVQPPTPDPAAPSEPAQPAPDEAAAVEAMLAKLRELVALAARGAPVHEGADLVVEHIPDDVVALLVMDDWHPMLCRIVPEAAPHADWLGKVRDDALADHELADLVAAARAELATAKASAATRGA